MVLTSINLARNRPSWHPLVGGFRPSPIKAELQRQASNLATTHAAKTK